MKQKRILDPLTGFIQLHADIPAIIGSFFPDWMDVAQNVMCPWHDEKKPSLHIYPDGGGKCFGCGMIIRDIVDLYAKCNGLDYNQAQRVLYADLVNPIPQAQVNQFKTLLKGKPLDWLLIERNLSPEIIKRYDLGYDPHDNRIVVPIYDQFKFVRNMRRIAWAEGAKFKVTNTNGHGDCRVYPEIVLALSRKVLLVEGELDCLVASSYGIPAITWTGGADSWGEEHLPLFRGKCVWILYDADDAGQRGADKQAAILRRYASRVEIVKPLSKEGKDMTDWSFIYPTAVVDLANRINDFKVEATKAKSKVCLCCGQEIKR